MIKPVNDHLLIEPLIHKTFLPSEKGTFEEIGIVIDGGTSGLEKGTKVYFDSWVSAKYPKEDAKDENDFYWFVQFKDIRATENGNTISE